MGERARELDRLETDAEALRAEVGRLRADLAAALAERDALLGLMVVQIAEARPWGGERWQCCHRSRGGWSIEDHDSRESAVAAVRAAAGLGPEGG